MIGVLVVLGVVVVWWAAVDHGRTGSEVVSTAVMWFDAGAGGESADVDGMQAGLQDALSAAQDGAARDGFSLTLTSGYRTAAEQERLLVDAVQKYGSRDEALRWVFTPERSMHVHGYAADVGDRNAAGWLEEHGARFGLCRTLSWEWWHFEWRRQWAESRTCPPPVDDPEDAPRIAVDG